MALPGVEITITLDSIDAETQPQVDMHGAQNVRQKQADQKDKQQQPHIQQAQQRTDSSSGATEQMQSPQDQPQAGQSSGSAASARPKLLPGLLNEIRNFRTQSGMSFCIILQFRYSSLLNTGLRLAFFQ